MTITYELNHSLYINMTNRCYNDCTFCIRRNGEGVYGSDSLWLDEEPSKEAILEEVLQKQPEQYKAIVFCGYGEPLIRLYDVIWICKKLREETKTPIRINTNGTADLIANEPTARLFEGLVDEVSVSLNASDSEKYQALCKPLWGEDSYYAVLRFIRECKRHIPRVIVTVLDSIGQDEIEKCRTIAADMGVEYRVREKV